MAKIEIETKDIILCVEVIVALIIAVLVGAYVFSPALHIGTPATTPTVSPTPVPTPTPYPVTWSTVQRVNYLTTSAGFFQATTDRGETYILQNPDDYYALSTGYRVTFQRCGTDNKFNGFQWKACAVQVVSIPWESRRDDGYYDYNDDDYPVYYYDSQTHTAWQWDGYNADPISVKQLRGEKIIRGLPPGR